MNAERDDDSKKRATNNDQFVDHLAAIDEALAKGQAPERGIEDAGDEVRQRLERGAACLELLNQHWPRQSRTRQLRHITRLG